MYLWSGDRKGESREQKTREAVRGREHAGSQGTLLGIQLLLGSRWGAIDGLRAQEWPDG